MSKHNIPHVKHAKHEKDHDNAIELVIKLWREGKIGFKDFDEHALAAPGEARISVTRFDK